MFRWHVVSAVFWRNVKQYFSGPLGYLFIVVFVTICAVMAFSPQFFADNQATLDQLSKWFPLLLLFFIPAITMTVWADEKRQGTDSILFTLPASDFDILMGKYLAVAAVYTIALLFSLTQVIVLEILGSPDWGVLASTYLGYWLAGLALLAVGMFASSLTGSATVAFVLGSLLCSVPVLIGYYFRGSVGLERFGFDWNLRDFTLGLIPLSNVVYFVALTIFMLYLNLIVISKRHWNRGQQVNIGGQYLVRAISLGVALASIGFLCSTALSSVWSRADLTSEKLYTLDKATVETLERVKKDEREVTIQAYVSKDVPRKYVNAKKQFVGLLRQFKEYGGKNVSLRLVDVEPNSEMALNAEQSGIEPRDDRSDVGGRIVEQKVFLGATVSTSLGDATLPFVGDEAAIEYELSRSISNTIDKKNQISVGIVVTDAQFAGPEIEGQRIPWAYASTMDALEKQFKIQHIAANDLAEYVSDEQVAATEDGKVELKSEKKDPPDVLLVADPSSLDDLAMENLVKYVEAGYPTLLLTDPIPFFWTFQDPTGIGVLNAPRQPRVSQQSQFAQVLSSSPLPKSDSGKASKILKAIGVEWDNGSVAWNNVPPPSGFKANWPEYLGDSWPAYYGRIEQAFVFIRNHEETVAFDADNLISKGLNQLLLFYPGSIKKSADSKLNFQPLVSLGEQSGLTPWDRLTMTPKQRVLNPSTGRITETNARSRITQVDLVTLDPDSQRNFDEQEHTVAAHITGEGENGINVVVIADLDFVSDLAPTQAEAMNEKIDNVVLLENSIDILAGNEAFVNLRNRRASPRALARLETIIGDFRKERTTKQEKIEDDIEKELEEVQAKLDLANKEIQENQDMGFFEKLQRRSQETSEAQKRFNLKKRKLDRQLKKEIGKLESNQQQQISGLENKTRYLAILCAPLPALVLGIFVLLFRKLNEERGIADDRRVKN